MAKRIIYGKTWWGKRWIEAMEKIDYNTNRLPRGKRYANKGAVLEIKINRNSDLVARVQGSRFTPYKEKISLKKFTPKEIEKIGKILSENPYITGQLLNGILPEEIEEILKMEGITLFPESWDDIDAYCSCPDWANPCKHLAAVYYVIANEIDREPFILFEMHGLKKKKLLEMAKISTKNSENKLNFLPINSEKSKYTFEEKLNLKEPEIFFSNIENPILLLPEENILSQNSVKKFLEEIYENSKKYIKNIQLIEKSPYLKETKFNIKYDSQNPEIEISGYNPFQKESINFEIFIDDYFTKKQIREKSKDELFFIFINDIFTIIDYYKSSTLL